MYDENDGFFDHMVPPTPPQSRDEGLSTIETTNEIFAGNATYPAGPYGLGVRVPMIVISPWSKGGWVNSEVFDHTSLIRFIERRFGPEHPDLVESNITKWRRAVAGDLTSAFDFRSPNAAVVTLPGTSSYLPPDRVTHPDYVPVPPSVQGLPAQEPGVRPARALPYQLNVMARANVVDGTLKLHFTNGGAAAAVFQVRSADGQTGPWTYTVGGGDELTDTWNLKAKGQTAYDLSVYGPNGFFRTFKGSVAAIGNANLDVTATYHAGHDGGLTIDIQNRGAVSAGIVTVTDAYGKKSVVLTFHDQCNRVSAHWRLDRSFNWYDLTIEFDGDAQFRQQLAGHVETGHDSASDPALGPI